MQQGNVCSRSKLFLRVASVGGVTFFLRNELEPQMRVSTASKVAANMKSKQALVLLSIAANGWQC